MIINKCNAISSQEQFQILMISSTTYYASKCEYVYLQMLEEWSLDLINIRWDKINKNVHNPSLTMYDLSLDVMIRCGRTTPISKWDGPPRLVRVKDLVSSPFQWRESSPLKDKTYRGAFDYTWLFVVTWCIYVIHFDFDELMRNLQLMVLTFYFMTYAF